MTAEIYPDTGVKLNPPPYRRLTISYMVAVTAHLMRLRGETHQTICHRLGINNWQLWRVFKLEVHPTAARKALSIHSLVQAELPLGLGAA